MPLINQPLAPSSAAPGGSGFTLTVNGAGFAPDSVVEWNGNALPTLVLAGGQLTAQVPASDIATAGTASVTVISVGAPASNVVFFPIGNSQATVSLGFMDLSGTYSGLNNIEVGDFNNDGIQDLALPTNNGIDILLGNGDGTFQAPIFTNTSTNGSIAVGDFNGDGRLDVIFSSDYYQFVQIFLGNGDGTFTPGADYVNYCNYDVVVGDFNGDGKLDFVANSCSGLGTYLGNGDGTFNGPVTSPFGLNGAPAVGDFDGDGTLDLAQAYDCGIQILLGAGDGTFQGGAIVPTTNCANTVITADFNSDSELDLAATTTNNTVSILLGNGDGTFGSETDYATNNSPTNLLAADFNDDGKLDLAVLDDGVCCGSVGSVSVLLGKGDGTFQPHVDFSTDVNPAGIAAADFNGDGRLDLAVTNYGYNSLGTVSILLQDSMSLAPGNVTYSQQNVGTTSPAQTVTLTNYTSSSQTISLSFTGADPGDFAQTNNCNATLATGMSCTINLTFTPTATGTRTANFTVSDGAPLGPQVVALTGTAVAPTATLSAASLAFGLTPVGTVSLPQSVTLTNNGYGNLDISSIVASAGFLEQNNCPSTLYPGYYPNSCTITVQFNPQQGGVQTGMITINDDAVPSPQTVSLSGTATVVQVSPIGIYFGNQADGATTPPVTVTLTNKGGTALTINSVSLSGADLGDFGQTNNCGSTVAAGANCTISATFTPTAAGPRSASLLISDSDLTSPQTVALSGAGEIAGPNATLSPSSLTFASQHMGTTSSVQFVTLTNYGTSGLSITSIAASGDFRATNSCGTSLASGASCSISVTFSPTNTGTRTGTLTISDNAGTGSQTVTLSGTGQNGLVQITGALTQIQVGANGSVWGINSSQEIYYFNAQTQSWVLVAGKLAQLSVGADGSVWGVNASHLVYRYNAASSTWDLIVGAQLTQVSVGYTDDVWGLDSAGLVYRYDPATLGWDQMPGTLSQIAVGPDGAVWGISTYGEAMHFNVRSQNWDYAGGYLTQIAVGYAGAVWGVSYQQVYQYDNQYQYFESVPGTFTQVAVGTDGTVWAVNSGAAQAYRYDSSQPSSYPWDIYPTAAPMSQVAVGYAGAVWGLGSAGSIFELQPTTPAPAKTLHQVPGLLTHLAVAVDGNMWGLNSSGSIFAFDSATQDWDLVPGQLTQISVGFGGAVWGINSTQKIYRFNAQTLSWTLIPGLLTQIAVGSQNSVWGINASGSVYQFDEHTQYWDLRSGLTALQISVATDGTVWALNTQQQIYEYNSGTQSWSLISGSLTQVAVGSAKEVWGVNSAHKIYSYDTGAQKWDLITGFLNQVAVGLDGVAWGFNSSGQVFEYNSSGQDWNLIAGSSLSQIAVGGDKVVWGLNGDEIYRAY